MWPLLVALGWVLLRTYQGKPILPDILSRGFKSGAQLAHIQTPQGGVLVAIPNDTQVLPAGDPNGHPAEVFTLGSVTGSVTVTIPKDTPIADPRAAASAGILSPMAAMSFAQVLNSRDALGAPRGLSSDTNPASPPANGGAGGGDAGFLASVTGSAALFGSLEPFDRYNGAGPNYEYTDDIDVPRSTSLSRIRFEAR